MLLQTPEQEGAIAITAIISVFVLSPIMIAIARVIWKRASEPRRQALSDQDAILRRLDALANSVDAMAVEVERISEGQRFVTKLMNDRDKQALGAGRERGNT
ncbi:MAG TPA: hypothetical protein VJ867_09235 [Gemmatimonadaceae bacterium]|nr:hypothetical protein [Gemmatimonadaceae bacterium]